MAAKLIKYDYSFMSAAKVGRFGFKSAELRKLGQGLPKFSRELKALAADPDLSFRKLPYDARGVSRLVKMAAKLKKQFSNMVVVGIGGSDLGARAIYQALAGDYGCCLKKNKGLSIYFLGDTTDPRPITDLLKFLDLKKTVFYVVSKSGDTIEPLSNFLFLREKVIAKVGYKKHKQHFIITTNPQKGALLEIAQKEGYLLLPHYPGSGRYSVLSVNGLLMAACAGFDIRQLLAGARGIDKICKNNNFSKNSPFLFAALQFLAYKKRQQNISVLMPYSYFLHDFTFWARQLLGESVNKKFNLTKEKVNSGITFIAALGPTDQHSQIQLYIEGPFDKIVTFIKIEKLENIKVPKSRNSEIAYLGGHMFSEILNIEHKATAVSLMENKRPNGTIILPELNEYYLGQLFFFFEMVTFYLGKLLQVNVFDQPGVEQSKKYMYGLLGRKGYEKERKEINRF